MNADDVPTYQPSSAARVAFTVNAVVAWVGIALTVAFSGLGWYSPAEPVDGLYGVHPEGAAGVVSRLSDTASYFTIWSNVVVAVAVTLLARGSTRVTGPVRVLRLDALLMVTITAIVYQVLLAPTALVVGWSRLTDPVLHQVTPVLTVLVWLVFGPRGWVSWRVVLASLGIPLAWIAWMLARGALVHAYPYGFANVEDRGYGPVGVTLLAILAFGVVVAAVYWGLDAVLRRVSRSRPAYS